MQLLFRLVGNVMAGFCNDSRPLLQSSNALVLSAARSVFVTDYLWIKGLLLERIYAQ